MRVANKTVYDAITYNLGNITTELNSVNKHIARAKRIIEPSDDPVGLNQVLRIRSTLSNIDQVGRNISLGKSWLNAAESALTQTQNLLSDAKALCVQMSNATISADQRLNASQTVQNILDEIVNLANTEVSGRYIFAGSRTDTAAFGADGNYNGNNTAFAVSLSRNTTIEVGGDGEAVFGSVFETLRDLKTYLETDNVNGIQGQMDRLDEHFEHISAEISDVGSKVLRMDIKQQILENSKLTNTDRLSVLEDLDIAEAVIDLKEIEVTYQAALASSSEAMKLSLVDYLT